MKSAILIKNPPVFRPLQTQILPVIQVPPYVSPEYDRESPHALWYLRHFSSNIDLTQYCLFYGHLKLNRFLRVSERKWGWYSDIQVMICDILRGVGKTPASRVIHFTSCQITLYFLLYHESLFVLSFLYLTLLESERGDLAVLPEPPVDVCPVHWKDVVPLQRILQRGGWSTRR